MQEACIESLDEYVQGKLYQTTDKMVEELTREYYLHQDELTNNLQQAMEKNRALREQRSAIIESIRDLANRAHSVYIEATESINNFPSSIGEFVSYITVVASKPWSMGHFAGDWGKQKKLPRHDVAGSLSKQTNVFSSPARHTEAHMGPKTASQGPIVTGTSVLAIKFAGGVMLAADCLASYGSLARFKDVQRLRAIGTNTVLGCSGDIADFQHVLQLMDEVQTNEFCHDDGLGLSSSQLHNILCGIMYKKRSEMKPLWNAHVVAGVDEKDGLFLGYVDIRGVAYRDDSVATGYGAYIAQPLLRKHIDEKGVKGITEGDARTILEECMRVLYYRDCRSINKIQIATVTLERGISITPAYELESNWDLALDIHGY